MYEGRFADNLINTEIDIVIQTPSRLFIGEAKHEMSFGANADLVLAHQLIRQYVMAKLLLDRLESDKEVIPFVVGDSKKRLMDVEQVKFMIEQGKANREPGLKEENILCWDDIEKLHP